MKKRFKSASIKPVVISCLVLLTAVISASSAWALSSPKLLQATRAEIARGSKDTSCSGFVKRALNRAGVKVPSFRANDFHSVIKGRLPGWKSNFFQANKGRASLRAHLNSYPPGTVFLAQWRRSGRSGHVALIEKRALNQFFIYQAQQGLRRPHSKLAPVEKLLYAPNQYGDRSRLTLWSP